MDWLERVTATSEMNLQRAGTEGYKFACSSPVVLQMPSEPTEDLFRGIRLQSVEILHYRD